MGSEKTDEIMVDTSDTDIVFYDVEVFKNLFLVVHKMRGKGKRK